MKLKSIFKGATKLVGGAVAGFLGSGGNPLGAIVGGLGGLFSGGGGGGGGGGSGGNGQIGVYIPPTTQEAYNIVKYLEGNVNNIANQQISIQKPYIDEAYNIFKQFPTTISSLFSNTENSLKSRYSDLFNVIQGQMQNQWSKSALGLSALGMYNTPATQLTQSDILSQLFGKIKEEETQALTNLDNAKLTSLIDYYSKAPSVLSGFSETYANLNPSINAYKMNLDLAQVLNGLSANSVIYPKASPIQQAGELLTDIVGMSKNLPSWDSVKSVFNRFSSIENLFS
ncbi:MAG: hypothetical protein JHC31_13445 [Sulfurihydrogenibium sp.]|jgi:hypothetical protein|nr:hypothetical protein [Sulfurihydrogenibium sp.]